MILTFSGLHFLFYVTPSGTEMVKMHQCVVGDPFYRYIFVYSHPHLKTTVWTECFAKDCIGSDHCTAAAES